VHELWTTKDIVSIQGRVGRRGETRKSFSLSLEMRVWITVNLEKTMAGEEVLTPLPPTPLYEF
jgi:hypothetical protein